MSGLAVFAVLVVALWLVQLKNNIYGPFNSNSAQTAGQAQIDDQAAELLALKNKDTDADGLSDYDELYLYKSSPYLEDSDSDGLKDGAEVKNNTDPNCPQGRTCLSGSTSDQGSALPASGGNTLNDLLGQYNSLDATLNQAGAGNGAANQPAASGSAGSLTPEEKQALRGLDALSLRRLLLEAGMDKATLDKISDAELMQSYEETLQ